MDMDTKEMTHQFRLSHWAGIMRERKESGLSIRTWCRENGVGEKTYYYWQRRLRESACEQFAEFQTSYQRSMTTTGFTEVKLRNGAARPALPGTVQSGQLQIEIGKVRIVADNNYPADKLAALCLELIRIC